MAELICFIASHVTHSRFPFIKELFCCIKKQTKKCPMFISWSSEDEECKKKMENLLKETEDVVGLYQEKKLSQFQHYRELMKCGTENSYIMFSDDDDLWGETRIQDMVEPTNEILGKYGKKFSRIIFPYYAKLHPNGHTERKTYKTEDDRLNVDHWATIVPYLIVRKFFDITPEWMISNSYCDVRFCLYTRSYNFGDITETATLCHSEPVYFYRIHDDGVCENSKKGLHRHTISLKSTLESKEDTHNCIEILRNLFNADINLFISGLSLNLEIGTIKYYPNMEHIKDHIIGITSLRLDKIGKKIVRECFGKLFPIISNWIKETYVV